jgi:hypothetical protein
MGIELFSCEIMKGSKRDGAMVWTGFECIPQRFVCWKFGPWCGNAGRK